MNYEDICLEFNKEFNAIKQETGFSDLDISLVCEVVHEHRTCKVTKGNASAEVCFPCNMRPNNKLDYAASIANAISWYMECPTAELYCEASGEKERCFNLIESTYKNIAKIFTEEEINRFCDGFADYF